MRKITLFEDGDRQNHSRGFNFWGALTRTARDDPEQGEVPKQRDRHPAGSRKGKKMKVLFLLLWLVGGVLVGLAIYVCLNLLRICEARQDAEHEEVWNLLVASDRG